ncbi:MAG: hypothetical protein ACON4U_14105 [Myxococcota bacterium]
MLFSLLFACAVEQSKDNQTQDNSVLPEQSTEDTAGEEVILAEWYGGIQPVVAERCARCHTEGGVGPFALDTYEVMQPLAGVALASIESGSMPPWMPDPSCREYHEQRLMSAAEVAAFRTWVDSGTPEGDTSLDVVPPPESMRLDPTHRAVVPAGFVPDTSNRDEYRCFILDIDFEEETYIVANDVIPGSSQVHHVLVYALEPEFKEELVQIDEASEKQGYKCFGSPYPDGSSFSYADGLPNQIGAWVPSIEPVVLPENTAFVVEAGSPIVMQVHYSALGGEPTEDTTTYEMVVSTEQPSKILSTRPLAIQNLDIPAGESDVSITGYFGNYRNEAMEVRSIAGHMHLLGESITAKRITEDGSEECMMDIPEWDFGWQQSYMPLETLRIEPNELMEVTCTYNNSAENQPIVNGEQQEPVDVGWGDGTLDEMCLVYVTLVEDYKAPPPSDSGVCYGADECIADCGDDPSVDCLLGCENMDIPCFGCVIDRIYDCALSPCGVQSFMAQECLTACYTNSIMLDGTFDNCMSAQCPVEYSALLECIDPLVTGDDCESALQSCNISF